MTATPLALTDVVLRDAHQSLLATRLRLDDMLPVAEQLDRVGYWSLESWGGATFDACIRYLGEDPWYRIRALKEAMPNTPQQMLLRGQNLLGYRHYADDVVEAFVQRAYASGVEVFRIFDALNDTRNLETAIRAVNAAGGHAQGTLSYTTSPVHTLESWVELAKEQAALGCQSLCIKDMAGLLTPTAAFELITTLKSEVGLPIAMQCHATTGLSTATYQKAIEAGIDVLDTAISSMSMTYGHTATETVMAMVAGTDRDTGLDPAQLAPIAQHFRQVRSRYAEFEGSLRGVDARILTAQVPGGMLTNMENQLKEQGALDRLDEVLEEIPRVREELGFLPLVTPTSQIVGTQAVLNILTGERYKSITKETQGVLRGEYGRTPAPVDAELQARVLDGQAPVTGRPADDLAPELNRLTETVTQLAQSDGFTLADSAIDDVLTYALFPQIGRKFLVNRGNPDAFEPAPGRAKPAQPVATEAPVQPVSRGPATYQVRVDGRSYSVEVSEGGDIGQIQPQPAASATPASAQPTPAPVASVVSAPLAGNVFKVLIGPGQTVAEGDVVLVMEAMKMETEIRASSAGQVQQLHVREGDAVSVGDPLVSLS
ncbi:sodium-extruding oxaloacetate decarboxylase subunit alpha [Ferrimonas balearica]|uniref:sodium-extruding oxaloacetate decarboxylase subunit alpha n=1 Tax=Ferrimonas balearica TaxID=44012 RepID=UPI001F3499A7|nr:sodium-extruding oxaloacetate decarboxylase subunit alpha [Ferrimonas balearica]MBY6018069.1 sodium-extruding oxaloacetate decarboxylase subunit alpha [Halomonas denitrificans]MBY6094407.1 sodium-extruding oxaloacetate decarboxylase subunit alpha [Ferrimonas balearica]